MSNAIGRELWVRWRGHAAATVLIPLLAACDSSTPGEGVLHLDDLLQTEYREELRIGSVDDPILGFSAIRAVRVSNGGDVYVLDAGARQVRVFDATGTFLRSIGRHGGGPGEFDRPSTMGFSGDTLWVFDPGARRLSWFSSDGHLVDEVTGGTPIDSGVEGLALQAVPARPVESGWLESVIVRETSPTYLAQDHAEPVVRFDRSGGVVDTVGWNRVQAPATVQVGNQMIIVPTLEPSSPFIRVEGSDTVVIRWSTSGSGGQLEVTRHHRQGDTIYHRLVRYTPVPVGEAVLDSLLAPRLAAAQYIGVSPEEMRRVVRPAVAIPDARPPIRGVYPQEDGGTWIALAADDAEGSYWIRIEADGSVRRVNLPPQATVVYSRGDDLWIVVPDDLDVQWLVRARAVQ